MSKYQYKEYEYNNYNYERSNQRNSKGGESDYSITGVPGEAIQCVPLESVNYDNNFEKMFKTFRAKVQKEKVVSLLKAKTAYEKPSDRRRRKIKESARKRFEEEALARRIALGLPVKKQREDRQEY